MTDIQRQIAAKQQEADAKLSEWRSRADARDKDGAAAARDAFTLANQEMSKLAETEAAELADMERLAAAERAFRQPDDSKRVRPQPERSSQAADDKFKRFQEAGLRTYVMQGHRAVIAEAQAAGLAPDQIATMVSQDDTKGGYLVGPDRRAEILKDLPGGSVMRSVCRVERTNSTMLQWPAVESASTEAHTRTSMLGRDQWSIDGATPTVQDFDTAGVDIPLHPLSPAIVKVGAMLTQAANPESIIMQLLFESNEADIDKACLLGNGSKRPLGILETSGIATVNSLAAAATTWPGLTNLVYTLPAQWRTGARFMMSSLTYAQVITTKDDAGNYIFAPNAAPPNTLLGYPVSFSEFMPAIAAAAKPIIFGNFQNYVIAEMADFRVQRLDQPYFPNVGFGAYQAIGGGVIRKKGFIIQVISA